MPLPQRTPPPKKRPIKVVEQMASAPLEREGNTPRDDKPSEGE